MFMTIYYIIIMFFSGFVVKDEDSVSCSVLVNDQSVIWSEVDPAVTDTHTTTPTSAAFTPAAPPDLIQNTPTFKVDVKVRMDFILSIL